MPHSPECKQTAKYQGHNRLSEKTCLQNSIRGGANMFLATGLTVCAVAGSILYLLETCEPDYTVMTVICVKFHVFLTGN